MGHCAFYTARRPLSASSCWTATVGTAVKIVDLKLCAARHRRECYHLSRRQISFPSSRQILSEPMRFASPCHCDPTQPASRSVSFAKAEPPPLGPMATPSASGRLPEFIRSRCRRRGHSPSGLPGTAGRAINLAASEAGVRRCELHVDRSKLCGLARASQRRQATELLKLLHR
jgi:hypothetical protein